MDVGRQCTVEFRRNHESLKSFQHQKNPKIQNTFQKPFTMHLQTTPIGRRTLLQRGGLGIGAYALAEMLGQENAFGSDVKQRATDRPTGPSSVKSPHFPAKAKSVIYLHMVGAPSHLDLFDLKPELQKRSGEDCPEHLFESGKFAFVRSLPKLLGTPNEKEYQFTASGDSGLPISNLMPHLQSVADEITMIKSMHTEEFNHGPAQMFMLSGFGRFGRPSIGSWLNYGLGTENQDLPGFVVLITGNVLGAGSPAWGSGFLPSVYQGVEFRSKGDPVLFLSNPKGVQPESRKQIIDTVNQLNQVQLADVSDPEIATRISQYELAYRMQTSVPELMDLSQEPESIHDLYGTQPGQTSFANNCLLARRLVEKGVRFVQLFDWGWDFHGTNVANGVGEGLLTKAATVDKPIAALIKDLRDRGILDDTLIICGGEFGRTPFREGRTAASKILGRDHYPDCFSMWMAGGGVKGGYSYGATDELGFGVTENKVHIHDFQATLMHLLGFDHERLTYRFQGRDFRLTDVHGKVVHDVIA
jgi:hypothetical protein